MPIHDSWISSERRPDELDLRPANAPVCTHRLCEHHTQANCCMFCEGACSPPIRQSRSSVYKSRHGDWNPTTSAQESVAVALDVSRYRCAGEWIIRNAGFLLCQAERHGGLAATRPPRG